MGEFGTSFGWDEFYKLEDATSPQTWCISCHFAYSLLEKEESPRDSPSPSKLKVQDDFLKMLEEPTNSDVTFLVGGERILAHKNILSARSKYFKAMFGAEVKENILNEVDIPDVKPQVFKGLLQFLYSGLPPKNLSEISLDLLVVADKYCVEEIEDICETNVCDNLDADNVIDALLVADKIDNEAVMDDARDAFRGHIDSIDRNAMKKLIDSPDLVLDLLEHFCKE